MIDKEFLESRRDILPIRPSVKVHISQARDALPTLGGTFPAEKRPMAIKEVRSIEAAGKQATNTYCFFQVELGNVKLKEGDIVEDLEASTFHTIESLSVEMAGTRIKANCSQTVKPTLQVL